MLLYLSQSEKEGGTMSELRQRLARELQEIPLVDTHEHFPEEATVAGSSPDFFHFLHYVSCDMRSSGMEEDIEQISSETDLSRKIDLFFRFWPRVQFTGYGQALKIMAHDLFGVEEITLDTFEDLNANAKSFIHEGYYETLLRKRANIHKVCRIVWPAAPTLCDRDILHPVPIFDHFATPLSRKELHALEAETAVSIHCLADLEDALEESFNMREDQGMVGVKIFLAYKRTLHFEQVTAHDAERAFLKMTQAHGDTPVGFDEAKPLQDYMIHQIIQRAAEWNLPIQIHTGFQNDNANFVENTRPTHLTNLFMTYPDARFVLLHGGWPYTGEFTALAKAFPNVFPDMAWTYIIGAGPAERLLADLMDCVPMNKILGFGGDYNFAEGAYAHARLARRSIRHVLAKKIEHGLMTEDEALEVAHAVMHRNAAQVYGFDDLK